MKHRVVINAGDTDVRVAFLEEGRLVEFHREHLDNKSLVGNVYRGVVKDVVPGLQAAFVDVGLPRNVFIHFMDVRSEALVMLADNLDEAMVEASKTVMPGRIRRPGRRDRPDLAAGNVEAPLRAGDNIIVQVVKDGIGDKAPRVSTNLALAGRYLVLLPFPSQDGGVSRRVQTGEERQKLRDLLNRLRTDQYSFIVRTAGLEAEEDQILADAERLKGQWRALTDSFRDLKGPGLVYSDHEIIDRMVRDAFSPGIDEIVVDDGAMADKMRQSLQQHLPELLDRVVEYDEREPVFERYNVETQLRRALDRKVWLKSGGYILVEETEALVAIDVNTGRFVGQKDQEKTSLRINMEACEAIAEQIRLRDLGGIIVLDFIDMLSGDNRARVSDEFRNCMRYDRAKSTIGRIGDSGLLTLTRKRKYQSLQKQVFDPCPYCAGESRVLKLEEVWRRMKNDILTLLDSPRPYAAALVMCQSQVAEFLTGEFAGHVNAFMDQHGIDIIVRPDETRHREDYTVAGVEGAKRGSFRLPTRRLAEEDVMAEPVRVEDIPAEAPPRAARVAKPAKVQPGSPAPRGRRDDNRRDRPQQQQQKPQRPPQQKPPVHDDDEIAAAAAATVPPVGADGEKRPQEGEIGEDGRRRTRRGRRGGRRRREREERRRQRLEAGAAEGTPADALAGTEQDEEDDIDDVAPAAAEGTDVAFDEAPAERPSAPAPVAAAPQSPDASKVRPPRPPRPPRPEERRREERPPRPERTESRPDRHEQRPPREQRRPSAPPPQAAAPKGPKTVRVVSKYGRAKAEPAPIVPSTTGRPLSGAVQIVSAFGSGAPVVPPKPKPAPAPVVEAKPVVPAEPVSGQIPRRPSIRVVASWGAGAASKPPQDPTAVPEFDDVPPTPVEQPVAEPKGRRPRPARKQPPAEIVVSTPIEAVDPAATPESAEKPKAAKKGAKKAAAAPKAEKPKAAEKPKPAEKPKAAKKAAKKAAAKKPEPAKPAAKKAAKKAAAPKAEKPRAAKKAAKKK